MKRYVMAVLVAVVVSGCSSVATKNFKVVVDPPDSVITVVSGPDLKEMKYHSPATVSAIVPTGSTLASKAVLDVRRDDYKPLIMSLRDIKDGQTLNIKLDPMFRYRLSYRLVSPAASDTLQFRDSTIAVSFAVSDQSFRFRFENLTAHPVKILWERAEYTDVNRQGHRLMHSGIRFQDRNNPIPDQIVPSRAAVQEAVIPVSKVYMAQKKKTYDIHPLFVRDNSAAAGLKGKSINLFIPVEVNRAIIPYNFKIEITDSVKEAIQG
ncbi:MAG: hypothetical protein ACM3MD_09065 [Betaproteobacteria bacterium]